MSDVGVTVDEASGDVVVDVAPAASVVVEAPPSVPMSLDIYTGQAGPQGPPGPPGGNYVHHQATPASTWVVAHNLGVYPNVTTIDSSHRRVQGEIDYVDQDTVTVTFSAALAGTAYLS